MFASRSILEHLLRGALGLGLITAAFAAAAQHPWIGLTLMLLALVPLRGCPVCWAIGLANTVLAQLRDKDRVTGPR